MDVGRGEVVAEGEHRQQRRVARLVAEVVTELSARQLRARRRLGGDKARFLPFEDIVAHERERDTPEIRPAAEAADHDVGILAGHLHLFLGLEADHRLVQRHMAQDRTQRIFAVRGAHRQLDRLGDGGTQRTLVVRMLGQYLAPRFGGHRRRGGHLCAERLHDRTAVGFLLIADLNHVDGQFEPERLRCVRERRPPLARAGLGGYVGHTFLFAVISLRDGRVQLVRPDRTHTLVFKIDVRRSAERLFEAVSAYQRRRTVILILFAYRLRDVDPCVCLVQLLIGQRLREDRIKVRGFQRLACGGIQRRHRFIDHVGLYVVPLGRDFALRQEESFGFRCHTQLFLSVFMFVRFSMQAI